MNRKERFYAVIGGCVGAVLTLAVCSFSPLGAQSQSDADFGKITCKELEVLSPDGKSVGWIAAGRGGAIVKLGAVTIYGAERNGFIQVRAKGGERSVGIEANEKVGRVSLYGKDGTDNHRIMMAVNRFGDGVISTWGKGGKVGASMAVNEHGGRVNVYGKGSSDPRVAMGVNEYGNGAISAWDKNGYLLK